MIKTNKGLSTSVKVFDLTRVLVGPYCGTMLADTGAEVIKIETPGRGDNTKENAPIVNREGAYFMNLNGNKRGMVLNLRSEEGHRIFKEMAARSDIILENYRPGVMEELGLGYEELRRINPAIAYGAVSGFGHYGSYSQRAGYDIISQAMSDPTSITGWPEGQSIRTGTTISDVMDGAGCYTGVLAAYINRLETGEGDKVDVSPMDSMASSLEIINVIYLCIGRVPDRVGNRYEAIYPYDTFEAPDGMVIIVCGDDKPYGPFKGILQVPELEGEEFDDNIERIENHAKLKPIIEAWTAKRTIDDVAETLLAAGIPASPVNTIDRVAEDPHIAGAREMFVELEHLVARKMKITGNQLESTNNKIAIDTPVPLSGQHTEEVLKEFPGTDHEEYEKLTGEGIFWPGTERGV